jgi:glucose/arabinose dehydrogenase
LYIDELTWIVNFSDASSKFDGSWNRTVPVGARVMVTYLKEDGTADKSEPFAEGWLDENGEYLGRPVDVAQLRDGSLLVSEDFAGALYRIGTTANSVR